jgi:hypothetical protein
MLENLQVNRWAKLNSITINLKDKILTILASSEQPVPFPPIP